MATNARETGRLSEAVAAEIRALLGLRKWKQVDLSRESKIPKATLSSLLGARTPIYVDQLAAMAVALDVGPDDVLHTAWVKVQVATTEDVYLTDGSLDPANTKGQTPSAESIARAASRRRPENAG